VKITFELRGLPATFTRSAWTGDASLLHDGARKPLADPMDLATQFAGKLAQTWTLALADGVVRIEKERPRLFAGFRPQHYRIFVDDVLVAEQTGF